MTNFIFCLFLLDTYLTAKAIDKVNDIDYNNDRAAAEYKQLHKLRDDFMCIYSIKEIEEKVRPVAEMYGTGNIYLFGSYARGAATESSDIDLIVEAGNATGWKFCGLYEEFMEIFGKEVDILSDHQIEESKKDPMYRDFLREIERDRIEIYKCRQ